MGAAETYPANGYPTSRLARILAEMRRQGKLTHGEAERRDGTSCAFAWPDFGLDSANPKRLPWLPVRTYRRGLAVKQSQIQPNALAKGSICCSNRDFQ